MLPYLPNASAICSGEGNLDGVRTAAQRLHRITESNDVDMQPATIELLEQLLDPRHRAAHAAGE